MRPADLHPLFTRLPAELEGAYDAERPWTLLDEPLSELLASLPSEDVRVALTPDLHIVGDRIVIGEGARLHPGAVIEGPIRIGRDVEIRPGAYLRGGVWIGDGCVVGANTEVKHAILLPGAKVPHLSYVGDSVVGSGVNLGAGTILSNFRFDGAEVRIPIEGERVPTGRRKLGALLGDGAQTGCNCVLSPGVVVGRDTLIYPGVQLASGVYPGASLIKLRQEIELVERRL